MANVIYCHCSQCRKTTGHYFASTSCDRGDFKLTSDSGLDWYQSSPEAARGFCKRCGSTMFWDYKGSPTISILAGTLDAPTGLKAEVHIFVADASDYYTIDDGLPQHDHYGPVKAAE